MIDQRVSEGILSNFFNNRAFTTTIPAQLVRKFDIQVVTVFIERIKGIKYVGKSYKSSTLLNKDNLNLLKTLCGDNRREYELVRNMLVQEMNLKSKGFRRGFINELESVLNKFIYVEKEEVLKAASEREGLIETIELKAINDYEGVKV